MSQYQKLLLIIDPALRHSPAVNHAAALAKASGASLHIAGLIGPLDLLSFLEQGDRETAREAYLQDHRDWLKAQTDNLRTRGLEVTIEVTWADDLRQDILTYVAEMQPDLLIKEVQHESLLKRAFFTPLDWYLLRHCPIPVYLVGASSFVLPRKIVAAVEVSDKESPDNELNERIIQQATGLAMQCGADLHLLYACNISAGYLADMDGLTLAELTKALRKDLEKNFLKLASHYGVAADHRHFVIGHPVCALSEFANDQNVDVIVMGKVQSGGMDKLLGSTTEHILYQVPCCVMAV